jgi:hypothetical protein
LLAPDGQANVIVSREPLEPTLATEKYAEIQGQLLRREFPRFEEFSFGPLHTSTGIVLLRHFAWTPPDGVPVTQLQTYYVEAGTGFTSTATSPSSSFERYRQTFLDVIRATRYT